MADEPEESRDARSEGRKVAVTLAEALVGTIIMLIALVVVVGTVRGDIEPTQTTGILAGMATGLAGVLLRKGGGGK